MLIFDEKKYAENIINNKRYETVKTQGRERCVLVRYLTSLNYSVEEIKKVLSEIPMSGGEYLSSKDKDVIFSKIIAKANEYEFVTNKVVKIYQSELDIIEQVEDDYARHLLFVYLVYYKWASTVSHLQFYSKKNDIMMVTANGVVTRLNAGSISRQGRPATGVRAQNLTENDTVVSVNKILNPDEDEQVKKDVAAMDAEDAQNNVSQTSLLENNNSEE